MFPEANDPRVPTKIEREQIVRIHYLKINKVKLSVRKEMHHLRRHRYQEINIELLQFNLEFNLG